ERIFHFSDRRSGSFVLLQIGKAERSFFIQIGDKSSLGIGGKSSLEDSWDFFEIGGKFLWALWGGKSSLRAIWISLGGKSSLRGKSSLEALWISLGGKSSLRERIFCYSSDR
ncbi:8091_t:CDS:10, partial [Funneliformis caledonium]